MEPEQQENLSEEEKRSNVLRLAFGGRTEELDAFCRVLHDFVPPKTTVVLRGGAVTGKRWKDEAPFDADGPGTSDLDVTLVGDWPATSTPLRRARRWTSAVCRCACARSCG